MSDFKKIFWNFIKELLVSYSEKKMLLSLNEMNTSIAVVRKKNLKSIKLNILYPPKYPYFPIMTHFTKII